GSNIMLKVNGEAHVEDSKIAAYAEVDNIGDFPIVLLQAGSLYADNAEFGTGLATDGLLDVDMLVEMDNNAIIARLNNQSGVVHASENAKSPSETQIAGISLINSGSDMIAGRSFGDAAAAVANSGGSGSGSGMAPFASIGGSNIRQHSGSYVDTKGWNIGIGFAKEVRNSKGSLLFGPILEYGRGSYESHLDNGTVGTGDSSFWGIGGIIRQNYDSGLYLEGSVRAGRMQNDYRSDDIGASSQSYDNSAGYYAMHMGVGKVMQVSGRDVVDVYGKLFYTHQNGSSARLTSGHVYDFAAIDSVRSRLGCRYTFGLDDAGSVYAGLAWQHEFGGTADATIRAGSYAVTAPSPGVKGDTGILELGWKTVSANKKLEASLGLEGYAGKQQGIGANASLMWHF
ncbi:autotransporter outer membrane beta-barrel domain-containing protein, partial [Anaerovibrio sp.]|uniref:autotransporter outer membrane beta-barrel domain-containing protein n=1 Tax=Anaerovibrio sp. TaxID=1872532 RepID=UPI003F15A018